MSSFIKSLAPLSLSGKLMLALLVTYSLIEVTAFYFQIRDAYEAQERQLIDDAHRLVNEFELKTMSAIEQAEAGNDVAIESILEQWISHQDIVGIEVFSNLGEKYTIGFNSDSPLASLDTEEKVYSASDDADRAEITTVAKDRAGNVYDQLLQITRRLPISSNNKPIAYVRLYLEQDSYINYALFPLSLMSVKLLLFLIACLFLMYGFIWRPTHKISEHISSRVNQDLSAPLNYSLPSPLEDDSNQIILLYNQLLELFQKNALQMRDEADSERQIFERLEDKVITLSSLNKELQYVLSLKNDFLILMGHEVRTPMNALLASLRLIDVDSFSEKDKKLIKTAENQTNSLKIIISDILDATKLASDTLFLESRAFDVVELVHQSCNVYQHLAEQKNLLFKASTIDKDVFVVGDHIRISQVLNNLLSNAIKFTHKGSINVELEAEQKDKKMHLAVRVCDTGIGMTQDQIHSIFAMFPGTDLSSARSYTGTGLGLSITKKLVDLMDGRLDIQTSIDKGTTIELKLVLPVAADNMARTFASKGDIAPRYFEKMHSLVILVVDDVEAARYLMKMTLEELGITVFTAADGHEAVEVYRNNHEEIDLIFMDCQMPVMSGFEASKNIRAWEEKLRVEPVPICALTAYVLLETKLECMESGMNDYITKPVEEITLLTVIIEHLLQNKDDDLRSSITCQADA